MLKRFPVWIGILAALLAVTAGLWFWLNGQGSATAARVAAAIGAGLAAGWIGFGLYAFGHVAWVERIRRFTIVALAGLAGWLFFQAIAAPRPAIAVAGITGMALSFMLGLELVRLLLSGAHPILGVARTMVDEAIRQKIALVFIVVLIVLVPVLPPLLAGDQLKQQVSNFLRYSLFVTGSLLSIMTVMLAARSLTAELESRVAFTTLTKPIARWQHITGKWLGLMALNAVLLTVAGVGIYSFTELLTRQQAASATDRAAVHEQILTGRLALQPETERPDDLTEQVIARLGELQTRDPATFGQPGTPLHQVPREAVAQVESEVVRRWLAIPPRGSRTYRFTGLDRLSPEATAIQLQLRPKARGSIDDKLIDLALRINDRDYPLEQQMRDDTQKILYIDRRWINDDGVMDVEIFNGRRGLESPASDQPTIAFESGAGLLVLYRVASFERNLTRGLGMLWVRLGFLAMLGLAAATFLGFPVACLACALVFLAGAGSAFLTESFNTYASVGAKDLSLPARYLAAPEAVSTQLTAGEYWKAVKVLIRLVGETFATLVPSLSDHNPGPQVAEGYVITYRDLGGALLRIGLIGTGVLALLAVVIYHRREVARVQV